MAITGGASAPAIGAASNTTTFLLQVQRGLIPGHSVVLRFGERDGFGTTVAGEDVTRMNELTPAPTSHVTVPIPPSAGIQMSVVSESAADSLSLGTGTTQVEVHYLDAAGAEQTEVVSLNGTTPVNLAATNVRFVNGMHTYTGGPAAGHIKIRSTATVGLVYSMIARGGNTSLVTNYMVPAGKSLYLQRWWATEAQGKRVAFRLRSTDNEGTLLPGMFAFRGATYLKQSASPNMEAFGIAPAFAVVKVSGWAVVSGAEASCSFWGILIDD